MPFVWNHVYAPGDGIDWQDIALVNAYMGALWERNMIDAGALITFVGGEDIQINSLWLLFQQALFGTDDTISVQVGATIHTIDRSEKVWWVINQDYTGNPRADLYPASGSLLVLTTAYLRSTALGANSFTRKHPREYLNAGSTEYNWTNTARDPNAFSNGDYARQLDDGKVYHRVAGAWVLAPGHAPDIVSTYGFIQPGDYLGYWVLNELRDVINLLTAAIVTCDATVSRPWSDGISRQNTFGGGFTGIPNATWAGAKTDAETLYNASGAGYYSAPGFQTAGLNYDPDYQAGLTRTKARAYAGCWNSFTNTAIDFYNMGYPNPSSGVFTNSGDAIADGHWTKWDTVGIGGGAADAVSAYFGSIAVPVWVGAPPLPYGTEVTNGYVSTLGGGFGGDDGDIARIYRPGFFYHA